MTQFFNVLGLDYTINLNLISYIDWDPKVCKAKVTMSSGVQLLIIDEDDYLRLRSYFGFDQPKNQSKKQSPYDRC